MGHRHPKQAADERRAHQRGDDHAPHDDLPLRTRHDRAQHRRQRRRERGHLRHTPEARVPRRLLRARALEAVGQRRRRARRRRGRGSARGTGRRRGRGRRHRRGERERRHQWRARKRDCWRRRERAHGPPPVRPRVLLLLALPLLTLALAPSILLGRPPPPPREVRAHNVPGAALALHEAQQRAGVPQRARARVPGSRDAHGEPALLLRAPRGGGEARAAARERVKVERVDGLPRGGARSLEVRGAPRVRVRARLVRGVGARVDERVDERRGRGELVVVVRDVVRPERCGPGERRGRGALGRGMLVVERVRDLDARRVRVRVRAAAEAVPRVAVRGAATIAVVDAGGDGREGGHA